MTIVSNTALSRILAAALIVIILHGGRASAAHPLDPLSGKEIACAVAVLRASGKIDSEIRFALIDLDEPPKADALGWKPGQKSVRKAFVVARRGRTVYEAVVDLSAHKLDGWEAVKVELAEARRLSGDKRYTSIASHKAAQPFMAPKLFDLGEQTFYVGLRKAGVPSD